MWALSSYSFHYLFMVFKQPLVSNLKPHFFHLDRSLKRSSNIPNWLSRIPTQSSLVNSELLFFITIRYTITYEAIFFSFTTLPGKYSILPRGSLSPGRRFQLKASLKNTLPFLQKRSIIRLPHNFPQGNLLRLAVRTTPIGQNKFPLSVIRGWRLIMTCNHPWECSFSTHSFCWQTVWGTGMGVG